jgi:hypothetical protein
MSFSAQFNVQYGAIVLTDPVPLWIYQTFVEMIVGDLPSVSDVYTQGSPDVPAASKSSLFAFNLPAGTLTTTDTYSIPPDMPTTGGTIQAFPIGPNVVTLNIFITVTNNMFDAPLVVPFDITGLGTTISSVISTGDQFTDFRSVTVSADALCLHEDSIVHTLNLGDIKIKDLKSNSKAILIGVDGQQVKLISNIRLANATKFILIQKGALGESQPVADMHIIDGHPILVDSKEILPIKLINGTTIKYVDLESAPIYTLVTEKRTFVLINNVPVCTWSCEDIAKKFVLHQKV